MARRLSVILGNLLASKPALKKLEHSQLNRSVRTHGDRLGRSLRTKRVLSLDKIRLNKHSFIVGASGFGKTNLILLIQEHYLVNNKSFFFFDPKADIEAKNTFKALCNSQGKAYLTLDNSKESICLNPVGQGSINQIADRIMKAFQWSEVYYKDLCHHYLLKALADIKQTNLTPTLLNIHDTLVSKYACPEIRSLTTKLQNILTSDFKDALVPSNYRGEHTINGLRKEGTCLYIGLSTLGYSDTSIMIGKLLLGDLLHHAFETLEDLAQLSQAKERPLGVIFDEFGSLATPNYIDLLNKCRGASIELTMASQTLSDFDHLGSAFKNQILENSSNLFILKQRGEESATYLSKTIGTKKTLKHTKMTEDNLQTEKGSVREVHELLCHADIIKSLGVGQCVLLSHDPLYLDLIALRKIEIPNLINSNPRTECLKESSTIYLAKEDDL